MTYTIGCPICGKKSVGDTHAYEYAKISFSMSKTEN